jgi:hypothetical protein
MRFPRAQPDIKLLLVREKATMDEVRAARRDMFMIKARMNDLHKVSVTEGKIEALREAVSGTTEEQYLLAARLERPRGVDIVIASEARQSSGLRQTTS